MAFDYFRSQTTADRLIARFGATGAIRRGATPTDHPARYVIVDYSERDRDGSRVLATDKKAYVSAKGLAVEPLTSDRLVEADGTIFKIINVSPLKPAGTVVYYELQIRR